MGALADRAFLGDSLLERLGQIKTGLEAIPEKNIGNAAELCPLGNATDFTSKRVADFDVRSLVPVLSLVGCPSEIPGLVASVIVDPVKLVASGGQSDVRLDPSGEHGVIVPGRVETDTTPAIVEPRLVGVLPSLGGGVTRHLALIARQRP